MKTKLTFLFLGVGLFLTMSCTKYPPSSERLLEDLAVVTQVDVKADFSDYKTYSMPDYIYMVTDKDSVKVTNSTTKTILDRIDYNMQKRGFVKVDKSASPDLGMQANYFQNTTVYAYYSGYWGYDYWGYYYPYYPVYYSSYTTGMLDAQLIDLKHPDNSTHKLGLKWNAFIRGILTDTHTTSQITGAVDQAFTQTPELTTTAK